MPHRRHRLLPLKTGLFVLILLGTAELAARALGHRPSLADDPALWALERTRLDSATRPHVTVLGASRMQYGIDLGVLRESFPDHDTFLLAISGASPLPVLEDLVRSPPPPGLLLVSMVGPMLEPPATAKAQAYVNYRRASWNRSREWERRLRTLLQERFAILQSAIDPRSVLAQLARSGTLPAPDARVIDRRRSVAAPRAALTAKVAGDAGRASVTQALTARVHRHVPEDRWRGGVTRALELVDHLRAQGTRTVFVAMPASGPFAAVERVLYPKDRYWAYLERACAGGRCGTLDATGPGPFDEFVPADYSHLAAEDKDDFTRTLLEHLEPEPAVTD